MALGTVKWYHPIMGYGFIAPDDGTVPVRMSASAPGALRKGDRVEYEMVRGADGRPAAENLRLRRGQAAFGTRLAARQARA